ncbi:helix-turn-helix domain-containing protein [Dongia rigui]|uniref:HTH cro/C1-type domain-containing protein n=1 Tax=Dongia rigui TaxID=940149 RepID=A0ABU5DWB1_9PROT|nr:hypothetical protein [Dongia rigui]MDY0871587.1 hypothetical protein [Dongia rigui]
MQRLSPHILAWWTKLLRETSNLSQDALAANAGLNIRTIQRIESAESTTILTRRLLSVGLGYDDPDVFEDPNFIHSISELRKNVEHINNETISNRFPHMIKLPAASVRSGEQLGLMAENCNASNFQWDEDLSTEAKSAAAELFDFLREYGDFDDCYSASQKLDAYRCIDELLHAIREADAVVHSAFRNTHVLNPAWVDKTPMPLNIAYLVVSKKGTELDELMVGKKMQFR